MNTHLRLTGLQSTAQGRDFITTAELAQVLNKSAQTIRKEHCVRGHVYGLKPTKLGRDLLWSVSAIQALLLHPQHSQ